MARRTSLPAAGRRIPPASASIPNGPGPGPSTGGSSTTAPPSIPTGKPWDPKAPVILWDGAKWTGDVPDGVGNPGAGRPPFIMKPDGVGSLFGPGLADGPFPEHYEPLECPVEKNLLSPQKNNPVIRRFDKKGVGSELDEIASCDPRFPFVCSTYRVSEHWQTGVLTRWCPWLVEMQPGMFVEMSKELAAERNIENGEQVIVKSARGELEATAVVTARFKPFDIDGNDDSSGRHPLAFRLDHDGRPEVRSQRQETRGLHHR